MAIKQLIEETLNPELKKSRIAKEEAIARNQQIVQQSAIAEVPKVERAPADQPKLSDGTVNPDYVPTSIRDPSQLIAPREKTQAPNSPIAQTMKNNTGDIGQLSLRAEAMQQQSQQARAEAIRQAFSAALNKPLPSLFNPSLLDTNLAGVGAAALRGGTIAGVGAGVGIAAGAIAGTGGAALIPLGIASVISTAGGLSMKEYLNQKGDSIAYNSAHYDQGLELQRELIKRAKQGGDPNDLILAYMLLEQEKATAIQTLEFVAKRDPSGFADKARRKIYEAKFNEQRNIKNLREQAFLDAMVNPKKVQDQLPESTSNTFPA
jgi:hypothetical protein